MIIKTDIWKRSADHHSDNEENSTPGTIVIINCVLNAPLMLISILGNALVLAAMAVKTARQMLGKQTEEN